jgi:hypothetical protein
MHANAAVDLHGMPDVHSNKLFFAIAGQSVHTQSHGKMCKAPQMLVTDDLLPLRYLRVSFCYSRFHYRDPAAPRAKGSFWAFSAGCDRQKTAKSSRSNQDIRTTDLVRKFPTSIPLSIA